MLVAADTVSAKLLLSPHNAGLYAGIATLAKIAIFIVSPLMWMAISLAVQPTKNSKKILWIISLATALCFGLLALYVLLPRLSVSIVLGTQFLTSVSLLTLAATAMGTLALATLLNAILAAGAKPRYIVSQTGFMVFAFVIYIASSHISLRNVLTGQLIAGLVGIAYYIVYSFIRPRGGVSSHEKIN